MILQLITTFFGWIALVAVGINLIGMLVRGLVLVADVEGQLSKQGDAFKKVASEFYDSKVEKRTNIIALLLILVYLATLFYFWNIGVVVAAVMIMVAQIPDLLWEIKHGRYNFKGMPVVYILTLLVMFAALPVLWYAFYHW